MLQTIIQLREALESMGGAVDKLSLTLPSRAFDSLLIGGCGHLKHDCWGGPLKVDSTDVFWVYGVRVVRGAD
jgi:hypothetical protein